VVAEQRAAVCGGVILRYAHVRTLDVIFGDSMDLKAASLARVQIHVNLLFDESTRTYVRREMQLFTD
jgi:hypothetical protein